MKKVYLVSLSGFPKSTLKALDELKKDLKPDDDMQVLMTAGGVFFSYYRYITVMLVVDESLFRPLLAKHITGLRHDNYLQPIHVYILSLVQKDAIEVSLALFRNARRTS